MASTTALTSTRISVMGSSMHRLPLPGSCRAASWQSVLPAQDAKEWALPPACGKQNKRVPGSPPLPALHMALLWPATLAFLVGKTCSHLLLAMSGAATELIL